jgi:hypothetical protein
MGFLDNSSITVDAILTKRGRQILAAGGDLNITKFALSDEEIDYTLWDVTHPNGTDSYGTVIENMSLLEATPNRTTFRSFLVDQSQAGATLSMETSFTGQAVGQNIPIYPDTIGGQTEDYIFTIENTNVVRFQAMGTARTLTAARADLKAQSINEGATTTVTVQGVLSGLVATVSISVTADPVSSNPPGAPEGFPEWLGPGGSLE